MSIYKALRNPICKSILNRNWNSRHEVNSCLTVLRWQSTKKSPKTIQRQEDNTQITKHVKVGERIKQTSKDVTNITVILVGLGVTCFIFWVIFKEIFSSKSPSGVFAYALKKCKQDPRVIDALGEPIKGHGEMTRRGRARHVSSVEYENNGRTYLRVKFYLKGSNTTATVQCETPKDSSSSYFRYLFVELDTYPHKVIVVEDNRMSEKMEIAS